MTDLMGSTAHELLAQVLARYGSIDVFIARLHALLDTPTVVRPAAVAPSAGGRHRLAEPTGRVPMTGGPGSNRRRTNGYGRWSRSVAVSG
ncbi:hypothetical protein ACFXPS_43910 [Nocardia sp. NPDC059091]|uniref:hypothetical protein n=1 Tax=unclassified Nocardia TaxID=2637762 RepID=UPI003692F337